jgi:hypothetical protein
MAELLLVFRANQVIALDVDDERPAAVDAYLTRLHRVVADTRDEEEPTLIARLETTALDEVGPGEIDDALRDGEHEFLEVASVRRLRDVAE